MNEVTLWLLLLTADQAAALAQAQVGGFFDLVERAFGPGALVMAMMFVAALIWMDRDHKRERKEYRERIGQLQDKLDKKDDALEGLLREMHEQDASHAKTFRDLSSYMEQLAKTLDAHRGNFDRFTQDVRQAVEDFRVRFAQHGSN